LQTRPQTITKRSACYDGDVVTQKTSIADLATIPSEEETMFRKFFVRFLAVLMFISSLFSAAPMAMAQAAPMEQAAANCAQYHTVQRGENLFRIARQYGTTYQALQRLNGLPNANRILVGQRLCVRTNATTPGDPVVKPTPQQFIMALQTVRMRSGPGTQYNIVGRVFEGMTARVTGVSQNGGWWRVICPNDTVGSCWVSADPSLTRPIEEPNQVNQAIVNSISVEVRESYPVQVVAIVRGHMPDACGYVDTFRQFREGNTFRIEMTTGRNPGSCAQMLTPFEQPVTLDTTGLPAGQYRVAVNNVWASFFLH
jgi:LysM repeat protein